MFKRTIAVAAGSLALLVVTLTPASPASGAAGPARQAESPVFTGIGKASAGVLNLAPRAGKVSIGFTSGIAVAQFRNSLSEAQAQTVDLGILGTAIYGESTCPSSLPDIDAGESPRVDTPTRVDSAEGDAHALENRGELGIPGFGAGRQEAEALATPYATAKSTPLGFSIPGVIEFGAGTAIAQSGVVDGDTRESRAFSEVSVTLAGTVKLSGLRWEANHRTGGREERSGRFDLGHLEVAGQQLPLPSDSNGAEDVINAALTFTGLRVSLPRVEKLSEPTDLVRVTPLKIEVIDSELLRLVVGAILNQSREAREEVFGTLSEDCQVASALLIADLGLLIAGGNGSVAIELGGADASTAPLVLTNPFGSVAPLPPAPAPPPVAAPTPAPAPSPPVIAPTPVAEPANTPVAAPLPVSYESECQSTHGFEWPACSGGTLAPVAVAGLIGSAVMGALDWRRMRRSRGPAVSS